MSEQVAVAKEADAQAAEVEKRTDDVADLDTLLAEFDQGTKPAVSQPELIKQPVLDNETVASINYLKQRVTQEDVNKVISNVFRDLDWDDDMKEAWIVAKANKNPAIEKAFQNRFVDPGTWQKFEKSLAKEIDKKRDRFSKVDEQATADHHAVAQAVRGASTPVAAEPPPDFSRMSNAEFERWKTENMK